MLASSHLWLAPQGSISYERECTWPFFHLYLMSMSSFTGEVYCDWSCLGPGHPFGQLEGKLLYFSPAQTSKNKGKEFL